MPSPAAENPIDLSCLPSVDEMLGEEMTVSMISELGRDRVVAMVRGLIGEKRDAILSGRENLPKGPAVRQAITNELTEKLGAARSTELVAGVRRVINATGVVIHTNLGRAPLSERAVRAMVDAAGYASIEYDLEKGSRGARGPKAVSLLKLLTGAEDVLAVNNCAAAALLVLSVFAKEREVIVSRGELVEIGGDFRIPDILTHSGAVLREVGTTNRTHLRDYEKALSARTAMILKVHPSNFRITGFTKTPGTAELAELAHRNDVLFYEDAGSGAMLDLGSFGIKDEPVIRNLIADGADLVSFSGDKLLGGPQSGIIAGRSELIQRLRRDPFYRALRLDKTITAALEATLEAYALESAGQEVPVLRMLAVSEDEVAARSGRFIEKLRGVLKKNADLQAELNQSQSAVGGGASPDSVIGTTVIELTHSQLTDTELERRLRKSVKTPVITRIEAGKVLIDLRTVAESEENEIVDALEIIASG